MDKGSNTSRRSNDLGSLLTENRKSKIEIRARIDMAKDAFSKKESPAYK